MKRKKRRGYYNFVIFSSILLVILDWFLQKKLRLMGVGLPNFGISFGIGESISVFWVFFVPVIASVIAVFVFLYKKETIFPYTLLLVGGFGNIVPRLVYGNVWDYIQIPLTSLWINLSDVLITLAVFSYILIPDESRDSL